MSPSASASCVWILNIYSIFCLLDFTVAGFHRLLPSQSFVPAGKQAAVYQVRLSPWLDLTLWAGPYASATRVPKYWYRYYITLHNIWRRCTLVPSPCLSSTSWRLSTKTALFWILYIHHSSIDVKIKIGEPYLPLTRLGTLEHLKSLISLDLGANKITQLEDNTFIGNRMLQHLRLDSNQVLNVS